MRHIASFKTLLNIILVKINNVQQIYEKVWVILDEIGNNL
jgi:hypothetical protein